MLLILQNLTNKNKGHNINETREIYKNADGIMKLHTKED